jgi:hypothetical protein
MTTDTVRALPDSLTHALNAYRDRCWRGGDPTPERMVVEQEIEHHTTAMVSAALDRVMPPHLPDDELRATLELFAVDAEQQAKGYWGHLGSDAVACRQDQEGWANHARLFRDVIQRLYGHSPATADRAGDR